MSSIALLPLIPCIFIALIKHNLMHLTCSLKIIPNLPKVLIFIISNFKVKVCFLNSHGHNCHWNSAKCNTWVSNQSGMIRGTCLAFSMYFTNINIMILEKDNVSFSIKAKIIYPNLWYTFLYTHKHVYFIEYINSLMFFLFWRLILIRFFLYENYAQFILS